MPTHEKVDRYYRHDYATLLIELMLNIIYCNKYIKNKTKNHNQSISRNCSECEINGLV